MQEFTDWNNSPAFEPGTPRNYNFVTKMYNLYPSVEEQVKEAQEHNLESSFSGTHEHIQLYTMEENCPHTDPEDDEKYYVLDDLLDDWMREHYPEYAFENPHKYSFSSEIRTPYWEYYDKRFEYKQEGMKAIPLYAEFAIVKSVYDENHNGVCLLEPMETCCAYCNEDEIESDAGVTENHCLRDNAKDRSTEFFWELFDADWRNKYARP